MRKQRAGGDVNGVGALALAPFRDLDGVGQHVAFLLPWDDVVAVDRAQLDLQVEFASDARADRADHLDEESRTVLQRAAVFVGAIVDAGGEKLGEEVTVGCVQLDAVEAGLARAPGAGGECLHEVVDLSLAGGAAEEPVQRLLAAGRAQCRPVGIVHPGEVHLPAGMAELQDVLAVEAVYRGTELLPQRDEIVAVDGGVIGDDASFHQHRHVGGDDRADAACGEFAFPIDAGLRERAVLVIEPTRDVGAEDTVFDREVAESERGEDDVLIHDTASLAGMAIARFHTACNSAGTKAAAGHCAQFPSMNSTSRPAARSRAAPSSSATRVPARTAPQTVAPGIAAWRSTLGGANTHCSTTASTAAGERQRGSFHTSRMRSKPRTRLCTAMPVA